jgi:endonuclease/exonuclease/phosphatase family metal-dependent hydrolase
VDACRWLQVRLLQAAQIRAFVVRKVRDGAAVILAGDFNVNGRRARDDGMADSDEYAQVWRILTGAGAGAGTDGEGGGEGRAWRDVLRDFHAGEHVITGGDEYMVNRGCKPASQEHCSKRLDYVLVADASDAAQGNVRAQACRVEPFETPQDKPYVRLSDHLAVEVDFAYD